MFEVTVRGQPARMMLANSPRSSSNVPNEAVLSVLVRCFRLRGRPGMEHRIVVGVTGVERQAQLDWAIDESVKWNASLLIVHCCTDRYQIEVPEPGEEEIGAARAVLKVTCDAAHSRGVKVETLLGDGFAGEALVDASHDASQLIVGTSHRSRLSHAQHSSVSTFCVRHAHCPVTIVPMFSSLTREYSQ